MPDNLLSENITSNSVDTVVPTSSSNLNQTHNNPTRSLKKFIFWLVFLVVIVALATGTVYTYLLFNTKSSSNLTTNGTKNSKSDNTYQVIQTKLQDVLK